jgi:hypothetical protein
MIDATENPLPEFMKIVDKFRTMGVRTNADTPKTPPSRASSAPRASACSAPSTCSTAKGSDEAAVPAAQDDPQHDVEERARPALTSCGPVRQARHERPRWRRWTGCR